MFGKEIEEYENLRASYQEKVVKPMGAAEYGKYCEILFSAHSCAIEGNSFSVDDTRELKEKGLGMIPEGKSLLEAFEMLDHFRAYEYVIGNMGHPLDGEFVKTVNRLVTEHTLQYRCPGAVPGEYTDCDMAAGDTVFGDHNELIARLPRLLESTEEALARGVHPVVVAARFHGFYEYLHPFRDGNGRTGRLLSNFILQRAGHPMALIRREDRAEYIACLRMIRTEGTDEHLVHFFFSSLMSRMRAEMEQKKGNTNRILGMFF